MSHPRLARRLIIAGLVACTAAATLLGGSGAASAAVRPAAQGKLVPYWAPLSSRFLGTVNGSWQICGRIIKPDVAVTLTCGRARTFTKTFSASITGSDQVGPATLSAQVGFSVARAYTESVGISATIPKGWDGEGLWRAVWRRYSVLQIKCLRPEQVNAPLTSAVPARIQDGCGKNFSTGIKATATVEKSAGFIDGTVKVWKP